MFVMTVVLRRFAPMMLVVMFHHFQISNSECKLCFTYDLDVKERVLGCFPMSFHYYLPEANSEPLGLFSDSRLARNAYGQLQKSFLFVMDLLSFFGHCSFCSFLLMGQGHWFCCVHIG